MSQFVVNLSESEKDEQKRETPRREEIKSSFDYSKKPEKRGGCGRILGISALALAVISLIGAVTAYFYWQSVKRTPQYSLALLVDAGRRGDQRTIDEFVDTDAVVESFLPQVTDKATEMYGRNLPADKIARVKEFSTPLLPAIKQRARQEIPRVIQEKTDKFASVPYWAIALGAGYYLDVKPNGDTATVTSKISERQFELTMKRSGDKWRVVGIKDDVLATRIAQTVGQEIIAISTREGLKRASEKMNAPGLENIKKKIDELFR
jgi:hypothetical protein